MDDIISGAKNEQQAFRLYLDSKEAFRRGGFNLRKFITNSGPLQERIDHEEGIPTTQESSLPVCDSDESYTKATLGTVQSAQSGEQKIVGVQWEVATDQLHFGFADLACLAAELEPAKRNLVSIVGRFYDPMGFLSPILIRFKILFQELCEQKQDWDQLLSEDLCASGTCLSLSCSAVLPCTCPGVFGMTTSRKSALAAYMDFVTRRGVPMCLLSTWQFKLPVDSP